MALGTIVTMGTFGLNFEMFIAVRPVLEITMMHAADRFFDASDTDYKKRAIIEEKKGIDSSVIGMIRVI